MGYAVGSQCFSTAQEAALHACAAYPVVTAASGVVTTWSCSAATASSLSLVRTDTAGSEPTTATLDVSFPACDAAEKYADLSGLFGLFLAACAVVYAVKAFIYRNVAGNQ